MLVITGERVRRLIERLQEPGWLRECREELERMLEIKSALLWRAEGARACIGWRLQAHLTAEIYTLEKALEAVLSGDSQKAIAELELYITQLDQVPI